MIPQQVLSTEVISANFLHPRDIPKQPLIDYEYGGTAINDANDGLLVKVWRGRYIEGEIVLDAPGVAETTIITVPDITEFQFTFDQNMQPFVTYVVDDAAAYFRWFDTAVANDFVTTQLTAGSITPRCSLDDKRAISGTGTNDIVLSYVRFEILYMRLQSDRYDTEYELYDGAGTGGLLQVGMNLANRYQWLLENS